MPLENRTPVRAAFTTLLLVPGILLSSNVVARADAGLLGQRNGEPHNVALATGVEVTGTALTISGTPAAGAVLLARTPGTPAPITAIVDEKGNFTLAPLSPDRHVLLSTLPGDGWELAAPVSFIAPQAGQSLTPLQVVVRKPIFAQVTGKVVDPKGQPLAGVNVSLYLTANNGSVSQQTVSTDQTGTFAVPNAHDVTQASINAISLDGFLAKSMGAVSPVFDPTTVDGPNEDILNPDGPNLAGIRSNLNFSDSVMEPLTGSYSGQVVDQDGHPVAGALVAVVPVPEPTGQATSPLPFSGTGADGRFTLAKLPPDGLMVLAAYQGQFAELPLKGGVDAQIQIHGTSTASQAVKSAFIGSFIPGDFDAMLPYWDYLGEDKMRALALFLDGDATLAPASMDIKAGSAPDDQDGSAFGRWLELLAQRDPVAAARTGPALLAQYDPAAKLYAARAAVAGACANHGGPAGIAWANAWVDSFKNRQSFADPEIYIDGDTDTVNPLFRVAGVANALGRPDAGALTHAALAAAARTGPNSEIEFAKFWGKSLSAGGLSALHLLDGQLPAPARIKAWDGALGWLAQADPPAGDAASTEINALQTDPDIQTWDKRPEIDRNWDNLGIVMRDARVAIQTSEAETGSPDQITVLTAGNSRRAARLLGLLATAALRNHDQTTARTAVRAAVHDNDYDGWKDYSAALGASFDAQLGQELFAQIQTDMTRGGLPKYMLDGDLVNYGYYHGFQDPAESHLLLEFAWRDLDAGAKDSADWERGQFDQVRYQAAADLYPLDENMSLLALGQPEATVDAKKAARARVLTMILSDRANWALIPPD